MMAGRTRDRLLTSVKRGVGYIQTKTRAVAMIRSVLRSGKRLFLGGEGCFLQVSALRIIPVARLVPGLRDHPELLV